MKRFRALRWWLIAALLVLAGSVSAQQSAVPRSSGAPRFEAATIKPSPANSEYGATSVWEFVPNGDVMVRNAPLRLIIALAYQIDTQYQTVLLVGSHDLLGQRFDIQGKAPAQVQRSDGSARLRGIVRSPHRAAGFAAEDVLFRDEARLPEDARGRLRQAFRAGSIPEAVSRSAVTRCDWPRRPASVGRDVLREPQSSRGL